MRTHVAAARLRGLFLFTLLALGVVAYSQPGFDVASATANPISLRFDDNENTVKGFIYYMLDQQTKCCGTDALYLEVKLNKDGTTQSVRVLTGRNQCFKQSLVDILKLVRWDTTQIKSNGFPIYFDIKPAVNCKGYTDDNTYYAVGLPGTNVFLAANEPTGTPTTGTGETDPTAVEGNPTNPATATEPNTPATTSPPATTPPTSDKPDTTPDDTRVADADEPATDDKDPDGGAESPAAPKAAATTPALADPKPTATPTTPPTSSYTPPAATAYDDYSTGTPTTPSPTTKPSTPPAPKADPRNTPPRRENPGVPGEQNLPKPVYASRGELQPDSSHADAFANAPVPAMAAPEYVGGRAQQAVFVRKELKQSGVCGLVHLFVELTIEKQDTLGVVTEVRILRANRADLLPVLPELLKKMQYRPTGAARRQRVYFEFKADIICDEERAPTDLDTVQDYVKPPAGTSEAP